MKTSVLLAAYNGAEFIIEQLDSFQRQTLKPDEVIIIDDCSTDDTVEKVKNYIEYNSLGDEWKVVINSENKGWRRNFHDGISLVSGDIVFFSDQDDIWLPEKIEIQTKILESNPNINVIGSEKVFFNTEVPKRECVGNVHLRRVSLGKKAKNMLIQTGGSTMAFRRNYYDQIKEFYSPEMAHDDAFWKMSVADDSLLFINEPTIFRRLHEGNASMSKRNRSMAISMIEKQIDTANGVLNYVDKTMIECSNVFEKKKVISHYIEGNTRRREMIASSNIFKVIPVLPYYKDVYFNFRTFVGDLILTLYPGWRS